MSIAVYGGNPSGIAAAVEAARLGVDVIMAEPTDRIGGMWTGGLNQTDRELSNAGNLGWGIIAEMEARFGAYAGTSPMLFPTPAAAQTVFGEMLAEVSDKVTVRTGAELGEVTRAADGKVTAVSIGGTTYNPSNLVDATDAVDLAAASGCMMRYGRDSIAMTNEPTAGVNKPTITSALSSDPATGERLRNIWPAPIEQRGMADHRIMSFNQRMIVTDHASRMPFADLPVTPNPADYRAELNIAVALNCEHFEDQVMSIGRELLPIVDGVTTRDGNNGELYRIGSNWIGQWNDWRKMNWTQRQAKYQAYIREKAGLFKVICTDPEWAEKLPLLVADAKRWGFVPGVFTNTPIVPGMSPKMYEREVRQIVAQENITQRWAWGPERNQTDESVSIIGYHFDGHWVMQYASADGRIVHEGNGLSPAGVSTAVWQVPFGVLKPLGVPNLIVARGIGATRNGWMPARIELSYTKLGQVCGMAAALADLKGVAIAALDYKTDMLPALQAAGAILTLPEV